MDDFKTAIGFRALNIVRDSVPPMSTKKRKPSRPRPKPKAKSTRKPKGKPTTKPKGKPKTKPKAATRTKRKAESAPAKNDESLATFKDALAMLGLLVNNGATLDGDRFRGSLRAFLWFGHEPAFEDLREAATAALPVLAGYMIQVAAEEGGEYRLGRLQEALDLLVTYLDQAAINLPESSEATDVVSTGLYGVAEALDQRGGSILDISPIVREKQDELLARPGLSASLRKLLATSDGEKVRNLQARFSDLSVAKNCVYNLVRATGDKLLPEIEATIFDLHPADQDYLLHGLDAFPNSKRVLAFYDRFLERNRYASLAEQVAKYRARVESGIKTTGWET